MQLFGLSVLAVLCASAAASPAPAFIPATTQEGLPCFPPTFGCGTKLSPQCCHPGELCKDVPHLNPDCTCVYGEVFCPDTEVEKRDAAPEPGVGPVCLPPTYGCGTDLDPKCCAPAPVCHINTCACGTEADPQCCKLPPLGAKCGLEMPPCCTCEDDVIICDAPRGPTPLPKPKTRRNAALGPRQESSCPVDTCACGTATEPQCCALPPVGANCGIELPPCCTCEDGVVVCDAVRGD